MTRWQRSEIIGSLRLRLRPWRYARPASRGAWWMLGGAFAAFTVSAGLMHSYAVFLVAFIEEFRWSRAETSIAYSVSQLVAGASSPLAGALVDRLGPRRLLLLGSSLLVLGLVGSAFISALWQIILLYGIVMTIGANCLGLVVAALAPFCTAARHGNLDRAIGQRLRARRVGAARSIADLDHRLASHLSGAGGVHGRGRAVARRAVSPCRPLPDRG